MSNTLFSKATRNERFILLKIVCYVTILYDLVRK
jgi:hypothetical protein